MTGAKEPRAEAIRKHITKRVVDFAEPLDGKALFIWDDEITGFGVKINPKGRKVYVFQYRVSAPGQSAKTPARRYTIGKHGNITAAQARERAGELAIAVTIGKKDPLEVEKLARTERDRAAHAQTEQTRIETELAFSAYADRWLIHYEQNGGRGKGVKVRPSSIAQARLVVDRYLKPHLKNMPIPQIQKRDIRAIINGMPVEHIGMRRAVFSYASILFGQAARDDIIPANFFCDMDKPATPAKRERALEDDELAEVWQATAFLPKPFGHFYRLLILTMQRRSEVAGIDWSELNRETKQWLIPVARTKNKRTHLVALSELSIQELDLLAGGKNWPKSGLVLTTTGKTPISGVSKSKAALDKKVAEIRGEGESIKSWRTHDLRRTGATGLQKMGIRLEVTEAVLNHAGESKSGIVSVYQTYNWADEKQAALIAWGNRVATIIGETSEDNVIPLIREVNSA